MLGWLVQRWGEDQGQHQISGRCWKFWCSILFNLVHLGGIPGAGGAKVIGRREHQGQSCTRYLDTTLCSKPIELAPMSRLKRHIFLFCWVLFLVIWSITLSLLLLSDPVFPIFGSHLENVQLVYLRSFHKTDSSPDFWISLKKEIVLNTNPVCAKSRTPH